MKLIGIEFHGFKSFPDAAEVRFHDGITAIVGPNGCGKSNISDALRWVLGEQRPTAIRGARMDEAIFEGTEKRKPIHRAEVILSLSNDDHLLPVPYSEVAISRTVHRGGEGHEYRLNGTLCRLRDIQDLCRDTGLGTNAYAIIEGRMIDAILSDHAEERRQMFEEAAGIGRYKERRRVATRRLDEADGDLARVDDLISEVETKVRSLARQRGRARRYHELRDRKLALELALARFDQDRLETRSSEIQSELGRIEEEGVTLSTRLRTAEAEHEAARTRLIELEQNRAESARRVLEVRDKLSELEKERILAQERARHARMRLEQITVDRAELAERKQELGVEVEELSRKRGERAAVLQSVRSRLEEKELELAAANERREALEGAARAVEDAERTYRETRARLLARVEGSRAHAGELADRLSEARDARTRLVDGLASAQSAADAACQAVDGAQEQFDELNQTLSAQRAELERARENLSESRTLQAAAAERLSATRARIEVVEPLALGEEGMNPAVKEALARARKLGVLAVLGRCIDVSHELAEGVEAYLGPLLQALIVADDEAARRVQRWFLEDYDGPGGLILLPLDRAPASEASLPSEVRVRGEAARWLRYLLSGVRFGSPESGTGAWIGQRASVDARGIYRLGQPIAGPGALAHRAELEKLRQREKELDGQAGAELEALQRTERETAELASHIGKLETSRRGAEEDLARLAARAEAEQERLSRVAMEKEAAEKTVERIESDQQGAVQAGSMAQAELGALVPAGAVEAPDAQALGVARGQWQEKQEAVSELRVNEARAAADVENSDRDLRAQRSAGEAASARMKKLSEEAEELAEVLAGSEERVETLAHELQELFEQRTTRDGEAREMEGAAESLRDEASKIEETLRRTQKQEREDSEKRHEFELERSELQSELRRVKERLEDEWGRPFEELLGQAEPATGVGDELRTELTDVAQRLAGIGLVNMLAEQEYLEEKERVEFLRSQRADLVKARDDLRATIAEINQTATSALVQTLDQIRENFNRTFATLFQGGNCDVWLENPDDPLDSPIEISASPGGKRTQRIHLLSGGERALTALSLLFAIYLVKPSPFCVLDEVDAPLDETNIRRFVAMLEQFKSEVQFIVITHNPVTIEAADWIFGVTMEEPGVSKIVGVEFSEYARGAVA